MFRDTRRKKLRNQVILAALAVSLMTFGIWLNYKTVVDQDGSEEAARKVKVESSQADQNSEERGDTSAKQPAADTAEEEESYYIKEVDGVVKVFACQGEEKKLYLITSIPFELLSSRRIRTCFPRVLRRRRKRSWMSSLRILIARGM